MAIFDFELRAIQRSIGHSAVREAAYISGQRITDERTGLVHNFSAKPGVLGFEVIGPSHMDPGWFANELEAREGRTNSITARPLKVALPEEFDDAGRWQVLRRLAIYFWEEFRFGTLVSQHAPPRDEWSSGRNHHGHLLLPTRYMDVAGGLGAKARDWDIKATSHLIIRRLRAMWAFILNQALEMGGFSARVDHRSLHDRGIDRLPRRYLKRDEYIAAKTGRAQSNYARQNLAIDAYNQNQQQQFTALKEKIDAERTTIRSRADRAIDAARRAVDSGKRAVAGATRRITGAARSIRITQHAIDEHHRRERGGPPTFRQRVGEALKRAGDYLSTGGRHPHRRDFHRVVQQSADSTDCRPDAEFRHEDQQFECRTPSQGAEEKEQARGQLIGQPRSEQVGRTRFAEELFLDWRTVGAFANSIDEDAHGDVVFLHNRQGDAEVYRCGLEYSFRGSEEDGPGRGSSIWYGRPLGHRPTTLILVAPFACDTLAAWQAVEDPQTRAHAVLVSTAGTITRSGLDRLTKLIRTVQAAQRVRGHVDLVTLGDLNGTDQDEVNDFSQTLSSLAQTLDVKYVRAVPTQGTTWSMSLRSASTDETEAAVSGDPTSTETGENLASPETNPATSEHDGVSMYGDNQGGTGTDDADQVESDVSTSQRLRLPRR